jgi:hypothetical protein
MTIAMKAAVITLFQLTRQIKRLDFTLSKDEEIAASLLNRRRLLRDLESKSSLLEAALSRVDYIKNHLGVCIEMQGNQVDMILRLVSQCDLMAIEHIRTVSDLEELVRA